jgi:hypothetical protein
VSLRLAEGLSTALSAAALLAGCSVDLGELPARCSTGECPDGYVCTRGVCAPPGTDVPATIAELGNLRGQDLKILTLDEDRVLVAWQSYPYTTRGQAFLAKTFSVASELSEELTLEATWEADPGAVEPYFDVIRLDASTVLTAITAASVDDDERPRVRVFRTDLASGTSAPAWDREVRMGTIGYGNVSQPRFIASATGFGLGYFEARVKDGVTAGRLGVFDLDEDGRLTSELSDCPLESDTCCPAHGCIDSQRTSSIASGVVEAFGAGVQTKWVIDEVRPSVIRLGAADVELPLPNLAVPVSSDEGGLWYVQPSPRTGDATTESPVAGPSTLFYQPFPAMLEKPPPPQEVASLPTVRDTPRLAWAPDPEVPERAFLVSPGASLAAEQLSVYSVELATGSSELLSTIERRSTLDIGGVRAVVAGRTLFVVWLDVAEDRAVIRGTTIPL